MKVLFNDAKEANFFTQLMFDKNVLLQSQFYPELETGELLIRKDEISVNYGDLLDDYTYLEHDDVDTMLIPLPSEEDEPNLPDVEENDVMVDTIVEKVLDRLRGQAVC